ncbi:hypothetical protein GOP47_0005430 [Adiantum capillus-veneris]|uniref:Uncharacterized protein n=1 Tax=Adiantum capillus-veneris TaxID=13818 RepID=A0A9D4V528_ADICA|nr:hypothetical protein GOP47_0005430 [Adiantum capillus-veneris]
MAARQRTLKACGAPHAEDDEVLLNQLGMQSLRKVKKKVKEQAYRLLDYHACPDYLKDNEFILSYYRAEFSLSQALSSLFRWHNETLNVWTHLLGFLFFLVLTLFAVYELGHLPSFSRCAQGLGLNMSEHCLLETIKRDVGKMMRPSMDRATRWPFFVFMGGSMFCLLASTVCHLFTCHSQSLALFLMRVDYAGIATMIATSFFPPIYYVFQCEPIWQWIYLSTITTMGIITLGVLFAPALQEVGLEIGMAGCYCIGTVIYMIRVPERWKPGHFDLGGHSHNLFHILVIGGAYFHYRAALLFMEWRDSKGCS